MKTILERDCIMTKTKKKRIVIISIVTALLIGIVPLLIGIVPLFTYLYSIDFSLKEHLTYFSIDTHFFHDFDDECKEGLEVQVEQVNAFLNKTPDFFENYKNYCEIGIDRIEFYKKDGEYPENVVVHKVFDEEWAQKVSFEWPNEGFGTITLYEEYPGYIFFENSHSDRLLIYTGGERPKDIIDKYYESYDSVLRFRLAKGWYDIIPFDKKYQ